MNGMEMMLKSMGLGDIITQAQQMANDGTFAKIVEFANNAGEIQAQLARQNSLLEKIAFDYENVCAKCGGEIQHVLPAPVVADGDRVHDSVHSDT